MTTIFSYGGGRQTVAICVLITRGLLPRPDRVVMADTGRENPSTWEYLYLHVRPLLASAGLAVEVATHSLAKNDLFAKNGDFLMPLYTRDGMLPGYCSGEWKRRVVERYLRSVGVTSGEMWFGFALEERKRIKRMAEAKDRVIFRPRFPLTELMLTTDGCLAMVRAAGLPEPSVSSCWMCPHKKNVEWRMIRDEYPERFIEACFIDETLREEDIERGGTGVWLHHSRMPLREANLEISETSLLARQCGLGMCFV